ncbi:MAG TPA: redoxin domain-containing protein [Candidatus Limnocylindria bacterium]|nr:redoxin domain-containing protein [Candidatus Limnocylindria bacterium]
MRTGLRWALLPIVLLPVGWLLFVNIGVDPRTIPSRIVGRPVPAFSLPTIDGGTLTDADLAGRPAVINVWASWCDPCIDEHPVLLDVAARLGDEVQVVGVLYNDDPESARRWLQRYGDGGWPNVDDDGSLALDLGAVGPPETYFVDRAGIVRHRVVGPLTTASMRAGLAAIGVDGS